ncbi:hypothetical protein [Pseudomonas sp. CCI1.1]|uniref:hypothetical protein n=1 Tax=Pseudomonas sp. CCI1.1 TaxID=3048613 RepID=UPI002AC8E8BE|nr:hypothetical protein [Pseudomonas sp. CCI1.1]MEB0190015.1 hypothetical protein [Pseudomonas sp. CCI1.1]WPX48358.1 hypothetical protein RHM69_29340 [Pseudomonas sp. CCI1.1]
MPNFDVHERREDGGVGRLLDVIDRVPERRKSGLFIEFDGEIFQVLTGIRNFITVTTERWARKSGRKA